MVIPVSNVNILMAGTLLALAWLRRPGLGVPSLSQTNGIDPGSR